MQELVALKAALPCRQQQIDALAGLLGQPGAPLPPSVLVWGDGGSGRTSVLQGVLQALQVSYCTLHCVLLYQPYLLYQAALNAFTGHVPSASSGYVSGTCDSLAEFVRRLRALASPPAHTHRRLALVLYESEKLREDGAVSAASLCRLQELCGGSACVNVCVVLVSALPQDKLLPAGGAAAPCVVHFPQYSREELACVLLQERRRMAPEFPEEFHRTFVQLVLSVFLPATRSLTEMRHLLKVHWDAYVSPVVRGEVSATSQEHQHIRRLWRNIEPHLRRALNTLYVKEVNSAQYSEMQKLMEQSDNKLPTVNTISGGTAQVELPYYSKFLLLASYLASYNPARSDRRYFLKHHGKQKKTQAMIKAKERSCSQLTGPKQFPLDRLMAIFYSISDCRQMPSAALLTQLSTLVSLRLVVQMGGDGDGLDAPKYKCSVGLQDIRTIARTVDFDIVRYLYDFA